MACAQGRAQNADGRGAWRMNSWRGFCACGLNFKIWLFDGFLRGIKIFSVAGGFLARILGVAREFALGI